MHSGSERLEQLSCVYNRLVVDLMGAHAITPFFSGPGTIHDSWKTEMTKAYKILTYLASFAIDAPHSCWRVSGMLYENYAYDHITWIYMLLMTKNTLISLHP